LLATAGKPFLFVIPACRESFLFANKKDSEQVGMTGSCFLVYDTPQQAAGRFILSASGVFNCFTKEMGWCIKNLSSF
jgi:hypothetical protein